MRQIIFTTEAEQKLQMLKCKMWKLNTYSLSNFHILH